MRVIIFKKEEGTSSTLGFSDCQIGTVRRVILIGCLLNVAPKCKLAESVAELRPISTWHKAWVGAYQHTK